MSPAAMAVSIPPLPVAGWRSFRFNQAARPVAPCVLDHPRIAFTTSGRAAILLALEALACRAGDEVLVPTYHCPTMVSPILALGLRPVFYPIDGQGRPDLAWLSDHATTRAGTLLVPHYFGIPQPMASIREWCDARGVSLVEDCAHALFGEADQRPIGQWGDVAIASLTKFTPVNEGGCLMLNRAGLQLPALGTRTLASELKAVLDIVEIGVRHLRLPGMHGLVSGALGIARGARRLSSRPTVLVPHDDPARQAEAQAAPIDAAMAHRRLTRIATAVATHADRHANVARRRRHFERLAALLGPCAAFRPLVTRLPPGVVPYVFALWVSNPDPAYLQLKTEGVPLFRWNWRWPGLPSLPGDCGDDWSHHVIQVPCHQDLLDEQVDAIAACLIDRLQRIG